MYRWIWRKLPGPIAAKLLGVLLLLVAVVVVLFLVVFPWVGPRLPSDHVTVNPPTPHHTSVPKAPSGGSARMT
jgi:hypothetical protein